MARTMAGRNRVHIASMQNSPRARARSTTVRVLAGVEGEGLLAEHGLAVVQGQERIGGAAVMGVAT